MKIKKLFNRLPIFTLVALGYLTINSFIPLGVGYAIILVMLLAFSGLYLSKKIIPFGYLSSTLAMVAFGIGSYNQGMDNLFPWAPAFFFASSAFTYGIRSLLTFFREQDQRTSAFYFAFMLMHSIALYSVFELIPDTAYLYYPPLVSIVPIMIISRSFLKKKDKAPLPQWELRLPKKLAISWMLTLLIAFTLITEIDPFKQAHAMQSLSASESEILNELLQNYDDSASVQTDSEIVRLLMKREDPKTEAWIQKGLKKEANHVVLKAYQATLLGLKARDEGTPTEKINWVEESTEILDPLVEQNPDHLELRMIRGEYYKELPTFFEKEQVAKLDFFHVIQQSVDSSSYLCSAASQLSEMDEGDVTPELQSKTHQCLF